MNWDIYFLKVAREVPQNSKCLSRKIGAVIVKEKSIISTGYNGPARGAKHCKERTMNFYLNLEQRRNRKAEIDVYYDKCPRRSLTYRSGQGLHLCQAGHAERNAIVQAARNGISTLDTTLYCDVTFPCKDCCIEIINAGIKEIVCLKGDLYDNYAPVILKEANVKIREIDKDEVYKQV